MYRGFADARVDSAHLKTLQHATYKPFPSPVATIRVAQFRLPNYSSAMISDFKHLLEKIQQLAALSMSLRRENADLRLQVAGLQADNAALSQRMQEAHEKVVAVMHRLPQEASTAIQPEDTE